MEDLSGTNMPGCEVRRGAQRGTRPAGAAPALPPEPGAAQGLGRGAVLGALEAAVSVPPAAAPPAAATHAVIRYAGSHKGAILHVSCVCS